MNYLRQAQEILPIMIAWNCDVARFFAQPRGTPTLAVTY